MWVCSATAASEIWWWPGGCSSECHVADPDSDSDPDSDQSLGFAKSAFVGARVSYSGFSPSSRGRKKTAPGVDSWGGLRPHSAPGESNIPLFCCRYLAIGNLRDANVLLEELRSGTTSANEDAPPVPDSPLLHFLRFLLLT